jgi:transposase-like protein
MPRPHPPEFRQRAVELARLREKPVAQIATDLGISDSCLRNWMAEADIDEGHREGTGDDPRTTHLVRTGGLDRARLVVRWATSSNRGGRRCDGCAMDAPRWCSPQASPQG